MIIPALLAASLTPQVDAGAILSKMFAYYYDAKSVAGTISLSQTMGQRKAIISTRLQYEFPAKIYIRQDLQASYGNKFWLVTGDGVGFTYNPPYTLRARSIRPQALGKQE
jgi:outer membrane lipoprotein-sorting protein